MYKEKTRKEKNHFKGYCPFKLPRHVSLMKLWGVASSHVWAFLSVTALPCDWALNCASRNLIFTWPAFFPFLAFSVSSPWGQSRHRVCISLCVHVHTCAYSWSYDGVRGAVSECRVASVWWCLVSSVIVVVRSHLKQSWLMVEPPEVTGMFWVNVPRWRLAGR